jgi:thrombospondin type 3 repeat protein
LTVEFVADDRDGDGVPDGADACPDVPAPGGCPVTDPEPTPGPADPDPDRDGVLSVRDRCPTVKGTTDDGCLDADGDGISDAVDACGTQAGLGRDGCPQPLKATFSNLWTNFARGSRVERLQVKAPRGARVQWRCKGQGCKRRSAGFVQKRSAESLLQFLTRGRMLSRGAVIEVRVTAPLTLGTYTRFEIRGQRKNPRRTDRCITAAGGLTRC